MSAPKSAAKGSFHRDAICWESAGRCPLLQTRWRASVGAAVWALRLQPGVAIPPHTHSKDHRGFAIRGRWGHIDSHGRTVATAQDSYVGIRANESHADRCRGPSGRLLKPFVQLCRTAIPRCGSEPRSPWDS